MTGVLLQLFHWYLPGGCALWREAAARAPALAEAGFTLLDQAQLRASHRIFVVTPTGSPGQERKAFMAVTSAGVPPKR